jgi:FMN-dependent NADH-azoreductase
MKTLLKINTSIFSDSGQSSQLANQFTAAWQVGNPAATILTRDFGRDPVPHLTAERFQAFSSKPGERSAEQQVALDYSDALVDELKRADVIVLGLPLYNFGVPSALKAYFDHVARAGVTFRHTEKGPVGLLSGKKAYVFATRGGFYVGTPLDTQTSYVRDVLRFLGINDVEFVYAEGLGISEQRKRDSLISAAQVISRLASAEQVAAAA